MSHYISILIFFVLLHTQAAAQNLVLNPSFEDTIALPKHSLFPVDSYLVHWHTPLGMFPSTSDLFHIDNTVTQMGVPDNLSGFQDTCHLKAYAGVVLYYQQIDNLNNHYREYLVGVLQSQLLANTCYKVSFKCSLGDGSRWMISNLGILFSNSTPVQTNPNKSNNLLLIPQIELNQYLGDTTNWITIERYYFAQGGEIKMTIGNFRDNNNTDTMFFQSHNLFDGSKLSYLYLDSFVVQAVPTETLPQVDLGNDTLLCKGQSISFDSLLPNNPVYVWNNLSNESKFTIDSTGNYWVEAYNGCSYVTDTIHVEFVQPIVDLGFDRLLCKREEIMLKNQNESTDHPNTTFLWNTEDTTPQLQPLDSGAYWLQASIQHCVDQDSIYVYYHIPPSSQLTSTEIDTTLCISGALKAQNTTWNDRYSWSTGETTQEISIKESGEYEVYVENECTEATSVFNVTVETAEEGLHDYNIFTPNEDGENEFFTLYEGNSKDYQLKIYNRWGRMIWTTSDPKEHWDGGEVSDGTYYYQLSFVNCANEPITKKGIIQLLR